MTTSSAVRVRRHWGALRTPWVIRKLRNSSTAARAMPTKYTYAGDRFSAEEFVTNLSTRTGRFTHPGTGLSAPDLPGRRIRKGRVELGDIGELAGSVPDLVPSGSSSGGGGGGGWLDGADEVALVLFAILAIVVILAIAVPLGLIAIELAGALIALGVGISARLIHLKPWTVIISRGNTPVAAVSVKGWRTSRAVIAALRNLP